MNVIRRERCHVSGEFVHPADAFRYGGGQFTFSFRAYERHAEALRLFQTGEPPAACHRCGKASHLCLNEQGQQALYVHLLEGAYQAFCLHCSDLVCALTKERYQNTPHAEHKKLFR